MRGFITIVLIQHNLDLQFLIDTLLRTRLNFKHQLLMYNLITNSIMNLYKTIEERKVGKLMDFEFLFQKLLIKIPPHSFHQPHPILDNLSGTEDHSVFINKCILNKLT